MRRFVFLAALIAMVVLALALPAATHPGAVYYRPSHVEWLLYNNHGYPLSTNCWGRTDGEHGVTYWPPNYYDRYQRFRCDSAATGATSWHTQSDGSIVRYWGEPV